MEFRNADIQAVLTYTSDLTGLTIIPHPNLKGKVTIINREPVTVRQLIAILYSTLKDLGFTINQEGDIIKIVPLADTTIYEMEQRGEFPRRFALSPRCIVWDLAEVEAWLLARRAAPIR